tara:strand:- start:2113 stop:2331 length:219 start_codon:yes stop_codon:yes gene_type:complete
MEKKKLDWIISIIREEMMTANPSGKGGGGGSQTDPKGTSGLVGFDAVMGMAKRKKIIGLGKDSRNRWKKPQL